MKRVLVSCDPGGRSNPSGIAIVTIDDYVLAAGQEAELSQPMLRIAAGALQGEVAWAEQLLREGVSSREASDRLGWRVSARLGINIAPAARPHRTVELEHCERRPVPEADMTLVGYLVDVMRDPQWIHAGTGPKLVIEVNHNASIVDLLRDRGIGVMDEITRIYTTAGDPKPSLTGGEWHVGRGRVLKHLQEVWGRGDVQYDEDTPGLSMLTDELRAVHRHVTPEGREKFVVGDVDTTDLDDVGDEAIPHADVVMALAHAVWYGVNRLRLVPANVPWPSLRR